MASVARDTAPLDGASPGSARLDEQRLRADADRAVEIVQLAVDRPNPGADDDVRASRPIHSPRLARQVDRQLGVDEQPVAPRQDPAQAVGEVGGGRDAGERRGGSPGEVAAQADPGGDGARAHSPATWRISRGVRIEELAAVLDEQRQRLAVLAAPAAARRRGPARRRRGQVGAADAHRPRKARVPAAGVQRRIDDLKAPAGRASAAQPRRADAARR